MKGILEHELVAEPSCQGALLNVHTILYSSVKQATPRPSVNA